MRPSIRLVASGLAILAVVSVAACGGSSATPTPAPTAPPAPSSGGGSATIPSLTLPSGIAFPSGLTLPSGGAVPDAGNIVTADMAASILGGSPQKVPIPGIQTGLPVSLVSYMSTNGDTVTALIEKLPTGLSATALQAAMQIAGSQGDLQPVSGIGDAAGKSVQANEATLAFAKGDSVVVLDARADSVAGTDLEPKLEALAQQVLGKL